MTNNHKVAIEKNLKIDKDKNIKISTAIISGNKELYRGYI